MEIRLTASARSQLLALVAAERDRDRPRAALLVDRIESTLRRLAEEPSAETESSTFETGSAEGHRILYRQRGSSLWVIALCEADGP